MQRQYGQAGKIILAACATIWSLYGPASAAVTSSKSKDDIEIDSRRDDSSDADRVLMMTVVEAGRANDCANVLNLLKPRLANGVPIRSAEMAAMAYGMAGSCSARAQDFKSAATYFYAGTQLASAPDQLWQGRLAVQLHLGDLAAAVTTVEQMGKLGGKGLARVSTDSLAQLTRQLSEKGMDAENLRTLAVISDPSFVPSEPMVTADGFRKNYAVKLMKSGQSEKAAEVVRNINYPSILIELSLDKRFKALLPADFDERKTVERSLAHALDVRKAHNDLLVPIVNASRNLRSLGRTEEALALLKAAEARPGGPLAHADAQRYLGWWWDSLAEIYYRLGKYELMVEAYRHGAGMDEGGAANVSQVINLAGSQIGFGKPDHALATIAAFKLTDRSASPYGLMQMREVRGCASAMTGDMKQAQADLAYMREHEKDDPASVASMLVCMKDLDGAAVVYVRLLDDPDAAPSILEEFSEYDDPPATMPKGPFQEAYLLLAKRADMKAAFDRAGGTRRFHLSDGAR